MEQDVADPAAPRDFLARMKVVCDPSTALEKHCAPELEFLVSITQQVVAYRMARMLHQARSGDPVMQIYASDGWATRLSDCHAVRVAGFIVKREGRVRAEFLLERHMLKVISPSGHIAFALQVSVPRCLLSGKTGWHLWEAAKQHQDFLREQVPAGIVISWYLQDGMHHSNLKWKFEAMHELYYRLQEEEEEEGDQQVEVLAREKDWNFTWLCTSHVASNAIKWAMHTMSSEEIHDSIAILGFWHCETHRRSC